MNTIEQENIGIVFERNADGTFTCIGVCALDTEEGQRLQKDSEVLSLTSAKMMKLIKGEETSLTIDDIAKKKYLTFIPDAGAYNRILEQGNKLEIQGTKRDVVKTMFQRVVDNINTIEPKRQGDILKCTLTFKKTYERSVNEKEKRNDGTEKYDISQIDIEKISEVVKRKVIGQDELVDGLIERIYKNQIAIDSNDDVALDQDFSCVLVDGPSGTGKTFSVTSVAKEFKLPTVTFSAPSFSAAGYKGDSLENIFVALLDKTDGDLELAQRGIVILDEFDKLADTDLEMSKAVQNSLLKLLDGIKLHVEYHGKSYEFDTSKTTFICLGAFTRLRNEKISQAKKLNEGADEVSYTIDDDDLIKFGFSSEAIGRLQERLFARDFSKDDYIQILNRSEVSPLLALKRNAKLLYNKELIYDEALVERIAELAEKRSTGARALKSIVNQISRLIFKQLLKSKVTQIVLDEDILFEAMNNSRRTVSNNTNMTDKERKLIA